MPSINLNGKICYVEIPAIDIESSADFYNQVFGWRIRRRNDGRAAFDDTVEMSGTWVLGRKPASKTSLVIHIMVDNLEETIKAIISNGGKLVQPVGADLPEITTKFSDPAGKVIGLYQQPKC